MSSRRSLPLGGSTSPGGSTHLRSPVAPGRGKPSGRPSARSSGSTGVTAHPNHETKRPRSIAMQGRSGDTEQGEAYMATNNDTGGPQLHEILTELVWVEFHTAPNGEVYAYAPNRPGWIGRGYDVEQAIRDLHLMAALAESKAAAS